MPRRFLRVLAFPCLLTAVLFIFSARGFAQMGYTGADLERMGQWIQFNHLEIYRLEIPSYASPYAAALTSGKHGWRIVVFLRDGGVTNVDWDSGFLERPFQAANTDNFVLVPQVGNHFGIAFSGCKAQDCAPGLWRAALSAVEPRAVREEDRGHVGCLLTILAGPEECRSPARSRRGPEAPAVGHRALYASCVSGIFLSQTMRTVRSAY